MNMKAKGAVLGQPIQSLEDVRGLTWVNINYLFIEGLARCGYTDVARELRARTLKLLMRHNDIYEYYHPDTGDPPPHAASVFGWSSAVFVDLAIEASRSQDPQRF